MKSVCGLAIHKDSVSLCILNKNREHIEKVYENFKSQNSTTKERFFKRFISNFFLIIK